MYLICTLHHYLYLSKRLDSFLRVLLQPTQYISAENGLHLSDFLALVAQYKEEVALMHQQAQPGATPPPLPTSNDGMLKVKPIRDWALAKPQEDLAHYTVTQYEVSRLYEVAFVCLANLN